MKIYTKTGDKGSTSLYGGKRVSKDDIQIEAYGTVDELNAHIGLLVSLIELAELKNFLIEQQHFLFSIGAHLAQDFTDKKLKLPELSEQKILDLEHTMDLFDKDLEPLKQFILPGGGQVSAQAHVCRTVCRRAERRVVSLSDIEELNPIIITYLNRLSDFFFVCSRYLTKLANQKDQNWIQ